MRHVPVLLATLAISPLAAAGDCDGFSFHFGSAKPGSNAVAPTIELSGCPEIGNDITLEVAGGQPLAPTCVLFGDAIATPETLLGLSSSILVVPVTDIAALLDGGGAASIPLSIPVSPNFLDVEISVQAVCIDAGAFASFSASDGLTIGIGGGVPAD